MIQIIVAEYIHDLQYTYCNDFYEADEQLIACADKCSESTRLVRKDWWLWQDTTSPTQEKQDIPGEEILSYLNTGNFQFLYAGQTVAYTWVNRTPNWFNMMGYCAFNSTFEPPTVELTNGLHVEINTYSGAQRSQWSPTTGSKWSTDLTVDKSAEENTGRSHLTQFPINPSNPPPIAILDSQNQPAKYHL